MIKTLHWKWVLILLLCWSSSIFAGGKQASADDTIYSPAYLGRYQTREDAEGSGTESVVGVRVRMQTADGKKKLLAGGVDTWRRRTGDGWEYVGSEVNDEQGKYKTYNGGTTQPVSILSASEPRFALFPHVIKSCLAQEGVDEYSIIAKTSCCGQQTGQYAEYSFQTQEELAKHENSLMYPLRGSLDYLKLCSYAADGVSHDYVIYPMVPIQPSGKVSVNAGECSVSKAGKAFYNGSHYYIKQLPELAAPKGYSVNLEGWYDQKEGGTRYEQGSLIASSKTLYPHYTLSVNRYTVTCLDVIESDPGLRLGSSCWQQTYQTTASGAQAGVIPLADTYYQGVCYIGCSTQVVGEKGATVYRYFRYADYPVTVVDMVNTGGNQGKTLGCTHIEANYQQIVSGGSLLGKLPTEGLYYTGYAYQGESSARVETKGTTVYRYFSPISYGIRFDGNGAREGSMAPLVQCEYEESFMLPLQTYQNYIKVTFDLQSDDAVYETGEFVLEREFGGWSENTDGETAYSDGATVKNLCSLSEEKVLYANWKKAELKTKSYPHRLGYQFAGWSENPNDTQGKSTFFLTEDTTLYAIWKADVAEYHVEYFKENLDGIFEKSASYSFRGYTGKEVRVEQNEEGEPGYYMDASSSVLSGSVKGDGSLVLSVYLRRNTYTLQFALEGGMSDKPYPMFSGVYEDTIQIPVSVPFREHYEFAGWTAERNSTQLYCKAGDVYHIPNHNQTLYAVWKPDTYRVQYVGENTTVYFDKEYAYGEEIVLPDCEQEKEGYHFAGWKLSEGDTKCYKPGETVEGLDCTKNEIRKFYAVWKPANNTPFVLQLSKEGLHGQSEQKERIVLQGNSNQPIREAVSAHYNTDKIEELFHGFVIVNPEEMNGTIQENGTTAVELKLRRKKYKITVISDFKDREVYYQEDCLYEESLVLPEKLTETGEIAQFEDEEHVGYPAGTTITVTDNLALIPQHCVQYRLENTVLETHYVRHNGYEKAILPEEKGYLFDGWYSGENCKKRYCSAGESLQIQTDLLLEGKWSETKRKFQIRYEIGQYDGVVALEEFITGYQYGESVLLPVDTQLYLPEQYTFVGWYEQGDSRRTIIKRITPDDYGNKLYCLLLQEKALDDSPDGEPKPTVSPTALPSESPEIKQTVPPAETKPQNSNAPADRPRQTGNAGITSPINQKKKNASGNPQGMRQKKTIFTKQKISYCILSGKTKQVAVVGVGKKVRSLKIPSKVTYRKKTYQVTKIADKACYRHPSLKKIFIGKNVRNIGKSAFAGAKKLQSVTMGKSVKQIGNKAFYGTSSLKKLKFLGKRLQKIKRQTFCKTNKNLKVYVPKSCAKKYRKLLKRSGIQGKRIVQWH